MSVISLNTKRVCVSILFAMAFSVTANAEKVTASADIYSCDGADVSGKAVLVEKPSDEGIKIVSISMKVKGLLVGDHAVHIHETASCEPCGSAGGHFDPGPNSNPSPDGNHPFHAGDLINLRVKSKGSNDTIGSLKTKTSRITLSPGPLSINDHDGSAFIIHVDPDTYCPDGEVAGCAGGGRVACGIINIDRTANAGINDDDDKDNDDD